MQTIFLSVEQELVAMDCYGLEARSADPYHHCYVTISLVPFGYEDDKENRPFLIGPIHENQGEKAFDEANGLLTKLGYSVVTTDNAKGEWVGGGLYIPHPSEINNRKYFCRQNQDVWEIVLNLNGEESVTGFGVDEHFAKEVVRALNAVVPEIVIFALNGRVRNIIGNCEISSSIIVDDTPPAEREQRDAELNRTHPFKIWN